MPPACPTTIRWRSWSTRARGRSSCGARSEPTAARRVRVNDRAVTVGGLASLGARLARDPRPARAAAAPRAVAPARACSTASAGTPRCSAAVADAHRAWRACVAASTELLTDAHELARRVELLRHQADEIAAAAPRAGEDAELEAQLRAADPRRDDRASRVRGGRRAARRGRGRRDALAVAERELASAAQHDARFAPLADRAAALSAEAAELARDAAAAADAVDLDPAAREAAEERLACSTTCAASTATRSRRSIGFGAAAAAELERLENQEGERERLRAAEAELREALEAAAARLTAARDAAAKRLASAVNAELPPLGLPAGAFDVDARVGRGRTDRRGSRHLHVRARTPESRRGRWVGSRRAARRAASRWP